MKNHHPIRALFVTRMRTFYREPEAIFWTYVFPVLLSIGLGIAFRNKPPQRIDVDIEMSPTAETTKAQLDASETFHAHINDPQTCADRLRLGKTTVVVRPCAASEGPHASINKAEADVGSGGVDASDEPHGSQSAGSNPGASVSPSHRHADAGHPPDVCYEYRYDPSRPESAAARDKLDDALQRAAGRSDVFETRDDQVTEPGARYIDFLIPGLIGMNIMSGGLWGMGFMLTDMRVRQLLRRLVAAPMRKSHFMIAQIAGRLVFTLPELLVLLGAGWLLFDMRIPGNLLSIVAVAFIGALSFAGIGLLTAARARRIETISGLVNLVMLPMWLFSGMFFSYDRFPDAFQPFIQCLPLTHLIDALRAIILDGSTLWHQGFHVLVLTLWGVVTFALALRYFRWT